MMDLFNFIDSEYNTDVFYANGSTSSWQTWKKPKNCRFVSILAIGGGGGGGGGRGSAFNSSCGGGGGGGSSLVNGIYLASLLPDILYIQVGSGGAGGISLGADGTNGSAGSLSYVAILPNSVTAQNHILVSGAAAAGGGGGGTGTILGAAGTAGTVFSQSTARPLSYLGIINSVAGVAGTAGSSIGAAPTNRTITNSLGGGGGGGGTTAGGTPSAGASVTGVGFVPTINGGAATASFGGAGGNGYIGCSLLFDKSVRNPFLTTGGGGGGGTSLNLGGDGGNGGYGSGGGGGGGTYLGVGGAGGRGGDGLVIITSF